MTLEVGANVLLPEYGGQEVKVRPRPPSATGTAWRATREQAPASRWPPVGRPKSQGGARDTLLASRVFLLSVDRQAHVENPACAENAHCSLQSRSFDARRRQGKDTNIERSSALLPPEHTSLVSQLGDEKFNLYREEDILGACPLLAHPAAHVLIATQNISDVFCAVV